MAPAEAADAGECRSRDYSVAGWQLLCRRVFDSEHSRRPRCVRDNTGKLVCDVAKQDISQLLAAGWMPPTPIKVKARDGKTDLYGFMFKPTNFDASKKYPIVEPCLSGAADWLLRQRAALRRRSGDDQSLAELGFVVVCIDGMGTPWPLEGVP